jgi:protein-disulfide isomerase
MDIVIVGGFGTETRQMENTLAQALRELKLHVSIGIAAGIREMAAYNVHRMPALVIDGKILYDGEVPSVEELKRVLKRYSKKPKRSGR